MSLDLSSVHLPDDAFWKSGADHGTDPLVRKYKTTHFGVLVDAPREVDLSRRTTLPLLTYYLGTYSQVASRSFPDHALLFIMDPERNELSVAPAEPDDPETEPDSPETSQGDMPQGWVAEIRELDIRERVQLSWKPARILSQIILLDLPSNRVETRLVAGNSTYVDPEKEKFLATERVQQNPSAPYPLLPASSYEPVEHSPAVPPTPGIALHAQRIAVLEGKTPVHLDASFRLPVAPEELVKRANAQYNETHGLTPYAACLTIHLVAIGTGQKSPFHYRLRIPVRSLDAGVAAGHFTLDLSNLPGFPLSEQTVFLYAFAKDWVSDPVTIGIVDRRPTVGSAE